MAFKVGILPSPNLGAQAAGAITGAVTHENVTVTGGVNAVHHWGKLAVEAGKSVTPNIPPEILLGQIEVESGGIEGRISSAGAFGLTQFIPSTAAHYGVKPGDPRSQIFGQAHYLHDLGYKKGNEARAIGMYNPLNGQPNVGYANAVLAAAKKYKVSGSVGFNAPDLGGVLDPIKDGWNAIKMVAQVLLNPSRLGVLVARAYAFFWKLIWKAIWEVVIAPIWHWIQRSTDYYFNTIMSGKAGSGYYYNMAGIVTIFFWAVGYGILWGKAEEPGTLASNPRDSALGRAFRTGQNAFATRKVVKPEKVEAATKSQPKPVISEVPVSQTRTLSVARRRPVKVRNTEEDTNDATGSENSPESVTDSPESS